MKLRTTLILLLLVIGLGVWIKFFESRKPNTEEARRQAGNVLNFDREKLTGIVIQNGDDRIELHRRAGKWNLTAPVQDQADRAAVDNLISDLESWHKVAVVPPAKTSGKTDFAEYGLAQAKLRLKLEMPGGPPPIRFGKDAAFEGEMYVRLGDSKEVIVADKNIRADISKKPDDFRDRKLTSLTTAEVARAVLKTPAGEIELQRKGEHWDIVKPMQARGADEKIADLIGEVTNARIQEFVATDQGDLHSYGLSEPRGSITVYGANDQHGETLQIGTSLPKKGLVYVNFPSRHGVYALPEKTEEILGIKPNDLRDHHLVRIDSDNLDRIHITAMGEPETVLARKDEAWTIASLKNEPANSSEVIRLISTLNDEKVTRFVSDTASDLAKYGLDHPQLQLTFSSFASENTAESAAGEHPFLTLSFGKIENGQAYARIGEEPFIVAINHRLLGDIWADPLQWQDLTIFKLKPEMVRHFSRVTDREESFDRVGPQSWKPMKGDSKVDLTNVQSFLNTLTSLRAVRWAGATTPAHGFAKPEEVVTFAASTDKTLHKLTIGSPTSDAMWYAKIDERDGTFVISSPDFAALRLPLSETPAVTPTPPTGSASLSPRPQGSVPATASSQTSARLVLRQLFLRGVDRHDSTGQHLSAYPVESVRFQ